MSDGDRAMQLRADQLVLRECDDHGILRLTLNDPKTRNSLSEGMMDALAAALADAVTMPRFASSCWRRMARYSVPVTI